MKKIIFLVAILLVTGISAMAQPSKVLQVPLMTMQEVSIPDSWGTPGGAYKIVMPAGGLSFYSGLFVPTDRGYGLIELDRKQRSFFFPSSELPSDINGFYYDRNGNPVPGYCRIQRGVSYGDTFSGPVFYWYDLNHKKAWVMPQLAFSKRSPEDATGIPYNWNRLLVDLATDGPIVAVHPAWWKDQCSHSQVSFNGNLFFLYSKYHNHKKIPRIKPPRDFIICLFFLPTVSVRIKIKIAA